MSEPTGGEPGKDPAAAPPPAGRPVPRARTRTMRLIGLAALALFAVLLVVGVVPRVRSRQQLARAAQPVSTGVLSGYVVPPAAAPAAALPLAATTQARQD